MNPKISIIVPVYNVEFYLKKCIDSILNQTFQDFELILVNDGSTDRSGEICNEYSKKDKRIKVVHKKNGGQATARNVALDIARGEYIGFVDSDDYIEEDMYELLYNLCIEHQCDISNCSSTIYFKDKIQVNGNNELLIHETREAMKVVIEGVIYDECLWSKLIKRSLFDNLRIPEGIGYEDTAFIYKLIDRAKRICYKGDSKYNYIKRDNSTMDRNIKNIKIDAVLVYEEMYKFIQNKYPEILNLVTLKLADHSMVVMNLMINRKDFKNYKENYLKVSAILRSKFNITIKLKEYPLKVKLLLIANQLSPTLYRKLIIWGKIGEKK